MINPVRRGAQAVWLAALLGLLAGCASQSDWPQWRGRNRDAVWHEPGAIKPFPASGLNIRWRAQLGPGWSSPSVANGCVFVTDVALKHPKATEHIQCLDARTGVARWRFDYNVTYPDWAFEETSRIGPTATPLIHGGKVYTLGTRGDLYCLNAHTGRALWQRNLETEYHAREEESRASPLIEGDLLILFAGGKPGPCVIALNKDTGKEAWTAVNEAGVYSAPLVITAGGQRQLIVWTQQSVTSLDPCTGKVFWREPVATTTNDANASPVFDHGRLLISGLMFQLDTTKPAAKVLWPDNLTLTHRLLSNTSTPMLRGDYVYAGKSSGELVCLEAATGKQVWTTNTVTRLGNGSSLHLTQRGDQVLIFNDQGELILSGLTPQGYEEISRAKLVAPTTRLFGARFTWSPPAYANGCVFTRSDEELVCAVLKPLVTRRGGRR